MVNREASNRGRRRVDADPKEVMRSLRIEYGRTQLHELIESLQKPGGNE